jgi:hypothetical protein
MVDVNEVVQAYIVLRDARDALKKKQADDMIPITSKMQKLEGWLQNYLTGNKVNSLKVDSGTAFLKEVSSATVEDGEAFIEFVRASGMWELIERRCAKSVVDDYVEQHGTLPPGVKYSRETVCQVRRA